METLEFDHEVFNSKAHEADKDLAVRFFVLPMQDPVKSAEEGRPIFKDVVHIEIRVRGDRNNVIHKPVTEVEKRRFRDAWRHYEQGNEMLQSGTPLSEWPSMTKSMVEEMKYFGFFTVEHVANARDDIASKFHLFDLREKARHFIELAKGNAPLEALHKELKEERSEKEAMRQQLADMARRMAELEKKAKD